MIAAAKRDVRPIVVATRICLIDPPNRVIFFGRPAEVAPTVAPTSVDDQHCAKTK
jgi:hypothetical protein